MPTPPYVLALREKVGTALLWMPGATAVVLRPAPDGGADEVLLVERSDNGWWTPVTGVVDPGEHPATTAVRECLEEAGVVCEVEGLVRVHVLPEMTYDNGDRAQYLDLTFRCRWVSGEPRAADEESTDARWWPLDGLPDMPADLRARLDLAVAWDGGPAHL
ncbi:NUDIX hydrolase [Nocardioides litoris]|uniref:NUDIX hydrolase n=1 Tax=Nocardioides litoris TaxID=1926648 RepID=UPI00111ECD8E|nr:NUDIX domain-containing protein [Nocardioides litoris]